MVACPATPPLTNNQWREIGGMARTSKGEIAALPMAYSVLVGGHITPTRTSHSYVNYFRNLTLLPFDKIAALPMAYSVLVGGHITPKITEVNRNLTRFPEEVVTPN
jgi:hypothetical protein